MEIRFSSCGNVCALKITGRLDAANAGILKSEFMEASRNNSKFIFDLSEMEYIDSTGLGSMVSCLKSIIDKEGFLKLAGLRDKPRMIFEITRAYRIFDIYDSMESAVEACNISKGA
ncbi:STAS domain-containing protein [Lentisphaerota bacterium ZTH]|nr:STAS domain-containing protein [Lentisphaerota bacterium]WET07386.1 STAS domain-containing protein [Lentisphaerota bacterium ZTH]